MAKSKLAFSRLTPNERNPRRITPTRLEMLQKAIEAFGDLSGIIADEQNQLISGHQRVEVGHVLGADHIVIERTYDPPTAKGTVAEGYVLLGGERHKYRQVRWSKRMQTAAGLAANANAGSWDVPMLADIMGELRFEDLDLDLTMHSIDEREKLFGEALKMQDPSEPAEASERKQTICPSCGHEFGGY